MNPAEAPCEEPAFQVRGEGRAPDAHQQDAGLSAIGVHLADAIQMSLYGRSRHISAPKPLRIDADYLVASSPSG